MVAEVSNTLSTSDKIKPERGAMGGLVAALCLLTAGYMIFRENLLGFGWDRGELEWTINPLIRSEGIDRLLMPLVLVGRYLLLLLAPMRLSLDYGTYVIGSTVNWHEAYVYLGVVTAVGWIIATIVAYRRRQFATLFCLLAFALTYGMVSNSVILIGTIMGERLMYLPSAFFIIWLTALLSRWLGAKWFAGVIVLLAILGSVRTFTYARLWNDPLKLCLANLKDHPKSMHLHSLCVDQYLARGDYLAARAVGADSVRELSDCWESYRMCVVADLKMHDFDDAERVLTNVDRRCPGLKIVDMQEQVRRARATYESSRHHEAITGAHDDKG